MRNETVPQQLQRAHDLIEEAISIIEDLREELLYRPGTWFDRAQRHAIAALGDLGKELGLTTDLGLTAAVDRRNGSRDPRGPAASCRSRPSRSHRKPRHHSAG